MVTFANHSYEQYYQAVRRCWRFGQTRPVTVDLIASEGEIGIKNNMRRKAEASDVMFTSLVSEMNNSLKIRNDTSFNNSMEVPEWLK